jgi:photosystem II stability/assembly factor-like uncharacterized protein
MTEWSHLAGSGKLDALKWRCIGPARGGRVVAVAGDPVEPMVFYFGACAGGIWKTIDGGIYWRCISDGFLGSAAIGAIAVSRSDRNVIYAGTGETEIRLDVSYGDGMYKSTDAGRTWSHIGLRETKHIGRICIHPTNPDIVYVAALGDIFGPHDDRGVFRTCDGGRTWDKVLYRDADTGAIDISMDPNNPRMLFAAFWQTRRNFWNLSSGGPGSGLFRSTDGGNTWDEITRAPGLPDGPIGKVGVSVSPAKSGRVWVLIETTGSKTGLYRTDDYGARWVMVSSNRDLMHRPWYYAHVFADPVSAETVFVLNLQMWKSTDGGSGFTEIMTPHGDNHELWIDPGNPSRMVQGNDGGACVSFNGGITWSSIYNQPTAQFYRIDTDNRFPYRVFATQQDNTSIAVPSASYWGAIVPGDWSYPGTGESGFIAVKPDDPNVVYCGAVGSSPGGAGALQRYDYRTGQIQLVNVWPEESTGIAPRDMKYRFAWTFPIVFSPHDSSVLYAGGNHLFRTTNEGMSWEAISPDLSLNDKSRQGPSGGSITAESAGAEVHATCACVVESPHRRGEIWVSTDDGLVHVTRDDGASWQNVTPPGLPQLAYVGCVEISAHDADTVYVAATRYKLADYRPYLFRTSDSGRTWTAITGNLPINEITRVIRADRVCRGLLFVGTETAIHFSLDDGATWIRMRGGLPVVPVYDLKIKGDDLVAGTHGRSFWILDDIAPLRTLADGSTASRLIRPRETIRTKLHFGAMGGVRAPVSFAITFGIGGGIATHELPDGTRRREYLDVGENPPNGAIIYYWLSDDVSHPVALTFRDARGAVIIAPRSDDDTLPAARRPTARPGLNRYIWDMRHPGPERVDQPWATRTNKPLASEPDPQSGPTAVPGSYSVELAIGSEVCAVDLMISKDPRLDTTQDDYAKQFALLKQLNEKASLLNRAVHRSRHLNGRLRALAEENASSHADLADKARAVAADLSSIERILVDVDRESPRDVLRHPAGLNDTLVDLINTVAMADMAPTAQAEAVSREIMAQVGAQVARLDAIVSGDIAEINRIAAERSIAYVVEKGSAVTGAAPKGSS